MIDRIIIGQYYAGNSLIHRLDPRAKITAMFLYMLAVVLAPGAWAFGVLAIVLIIALLWSGISWQVYFRSLSFIFYFIFLAAIFNLLFTPGTPIWQWGPLTVTMEGLYQACIMAVRLFLIVGIASLLTFTTTPVALTDAIEDMLRPVSALGFPGHELAMMMTIALRFIPILMEEAEKVRKAQMARGIVLTRGPLRDLPQAVIPFLVPLFTGAFRRADELAAAMEARAYRGGKGRTKLRELKLQPPDYAVLVFFVLLTAILLVYRWWI